MNWRSTNCQGQVLQFTPKTFAPALLHPTVKGRFSNSHRRLSLQLCSTNCQGQDLQITPKTFVPTLLHQLLRTSSPIYTIPALLHQLSRTGSPIHTEYCRSSAAPPTVKDRFSNSHRKLSLQRCSTNCQGQLLQFTPEIFVPALLHQLSRTGSPIHTEDFRSSAAPSTVKDRFSNSHRRLSLQRCPCYCQGQVLNSHRRLSFQRCSTNCQGRHFQFTPKTFVPALLNRLSRTNSPIHTEAFRSCAAPPTVKDRFSNSHRRLWLQHCSTNCQEQVLQFTLKTFVPALCQGQDLQFTPKNFVPALLHQLSRTGSPIHTER